MANTKDKWSSLSMKERMFLMQEYVKEGITDLKTMRKHYNGIPYRDLNTSEYDYFNASPDMEPKKEGQHWDSRNPHTGRILKGENHTTFDLAIEGEKQAGYTIRRGIDGNLYSVPNNINYVEANSYSLGGDSEKNQTLSGEGGWSEESREKREERYRKYDPTGNYILQPLYMLLGGNQAAGEENEYWKAYLGLENAVPKMNPKAKTSWDDAVEEEKMLNGELPSDFYGTTPRMDLNIQAIADTLNVGKIVRNYDEYKKDHPDLPTKKEMELIYQTGKSVLENPGEWQQVDGDNTAIKAKHSPITHETNPLGMLADFGMMWDPKSKTIYVHDTYDFNSFVEMFSGKRPKEMKIRGKVSFDPNKGSKLLRDDLKYFYDYPEPRVLSGNEETESTLSGEPIEDLGFFEKIKNLFSKKEEEEEPTIIETDEYYDPKYISYREAPKTLKMYLTQTKNGKYDINSKGNYGDTHYDAVESRYLDLTSMMRKKGFSTEEINRLAPFLVTQMILEGGYKITSPNNNFGGMLDPETRAKIKFDTEEDFYNAYLDNLDEKWGDSYLGEGLGWRNAKTLAEYAKIINRENLNLNSLELYNEYNKKHADKPAYIYTPTWENNGTELMSDAKFGGIKNRVFGLINLVKLRQQEFKELAESNGWLKTMPLEEMVKIQMQKLAK